MQVGLKPKKFATLLAELSALSSDFPEGRAEGRGEGRLEGRGGVGLADLVVGHNVGTTLLLKLLAPLPGNAPF